MKHIVAFKRTYDEEWRVVNMKSDENMSSNNSFEDKEKLISISDMFAWLLYKWQWVLGFLVIGIVCGAFLWMNASSKVSTKTYESISENIDILKEPLSVEQIDQVDYLFAQYVSYKEYRRSVQDYLSSSLYNPADYNENVRETVLYYIESYIENAAECFSLLAVGNEEYEKIADVLGKEQYSIDDVYRRLSIQRLNKSAVGDGMSYILQEGDEKEQKKEILKVEVVAETEEQAEAVLAIVEEAFEREENRLQELDSRIRFTKIGSQISEDISEFMTTRQNAVMNNLNNANNALTVLDTSYINKLSADEKAYYNALKERDEFEKTPPKKTSKMKYLLIGILLGLVLMFVWVLFAYFFEGSEKTKDELQYYYALNTSYTIYRKKKGLQLFGGLARKLIKADLSDEQIRPAMAASDIFIRLDKQDRKSAYIIYDAGSEWQSEIEKTIEEKINSEETEIEVLSGNPLTGPEELQRFSKAEAVIFLVELKKTKRSSVKKWMELCCRYSLPVEGTITLEEC